MRGPARMHAILGASEHCIALHASDLCVPLVALDAVVDIEGVDGSRSVPLTEFYVLPGERPDIENVLEHGELITRVRIPLLPVGSAVRLPEGARPGLLRVRAHVRGRGAADRGRHDRERAPGSRRCRDDAVAGSRGRGDPPRRTRQQTERSGPRPSAALRDPFTVAGTAFQGRARPAHDRPNPAHRIGGPVMTTATRETDHR